MSRAEKFIQDYTRNCSNECLTDTKPDGLGGYISRRNFSPWLTPDQARKAVEIAKEEIYEWLKDNIHMYNGECEGDRTAIIEDLKQAMKDD